MDLFRWTIIVAFVVTLVTFILDMLGGRIWLQILIASGLAVFAVVHGMRKFGVPDSARLNGGIIGMAALAGMLIGSSVQEILEFLVILVLFVIAYFGGGMVARFALQPTEHKKKKEIEEL